MDEMNLRATGGNLLIGDLENPNKMPFSGVLTYLGVPSDQPPGGSGGRRVMIPIEVGKSALDSLVGMPINLAASMDDHDTSSVIGVIENARIGEETPKGTPIHVSGHIFAKSFPREATAIKQQQASLGFSYETAKTLLASADHNGEEIAVAKQLIFTGAAILFKHSAAYHSTSLAAKGDEDLREMIRQLQEKIADLEAKKLTESERRDFALPDKEMFPMPDEGHVRLAWDMVDRAKGLSEEERTQARHNILKRAQDMGMGTSDWKKPGDMKAGTEVDNDMEEKEVKAGTETEKDEQGADLTAAISALTEMVKSLKDEVAEIKAAKATEDKKPEAEVTAEPQRRSTTSLSAKFEKGEDAPQELFAAIDREGLDPVQSMAKKLAAVFS